MQILQKIATYNQRVTNTEQSFPNIEQSFSSFIIFVAILYIYLKKNSYAESN